jgi:hypothetical protein
MTVGERVLAKPELILESITSKTGNVDLGFQSRIRPIQLSNTRNCYIVVY